MLLKSLTPSQFFKVSNSSFFLMLSCFCYYFFQTTVFLGIKLDGEFTETVPKNR